MSCVHVFLQEVCILHNDDFQWDSHKWQEQIYGDLFLFSYLYGSVYLRRVLLSDEGLWGLLIDVSVPSLYPIPTMLAVRRSLAWCFFIFLQEVALDIVGLRRQLWASWIASVWLQVDFPRSMSVQRICVHMGAFLEGGTSLWYYDPKKIINSNRYWKSYWPHFPSFLGVLL